MLRYKRWTFEVWYQSECTNIPSLAPWLAQYHLEIFGSESYLVISFHHSILQLTFITQAWMFKFKTYAIQATHMKCTYKCTIQVYELAPPTCVLKILIDPFPLSYFSPYVKFSPYHLYLYFSPLCVVFSLIFVHYFSSFVINDHKGLKYR